MACGFDLGDRDSSKQFQLGSENLHAQCRTADLVGAAIVDRRYMRHVRRHGPRQEPRNAGNMRDEAGQRRVRRDEPRHWLCNFLEEPARGGCCDKPRADHFPSLGGGGPSLRLSLRSSSFSCASISARMRLDSACSRIYRSSSPARFCSSV